MPDDNLTPPDPERKKMTLRANTASQAAPILIGYVLSFVSAPIVVAQLGLAAFGIWAITGALAQYGALLDLGISKAITRYIAMYAEQDDQRAQGEVMSVAVLALLGVGVALTLVAVVIAAPVADALGGVPVGQMRWVMLCSVWVLTALLLGRALAAYAVGLERMAAPNVALVLSAIFAFVGSVGSVIVQPTLGTFATANAIAAVAGLIAMIVTLNVNLGGVPFCRPTRARVSELVSFGAKAQVVFICDLLVFQSDKIILGVIVSPAVAGAYELGSRVAIAARSVATLATSALIPSITADVTRHGLDAVRGRYFHLTRRSAALGFAPLALVAAAAPSFLNAWLGEIPQYTEPVLIALAVSSIANVGTGVASATANAVGRPGITARSSIATAAINIVLAVVLAPFLGLWGVLAATVVATIVGAWIGLDLVHRALDLSNVKYFEAVSGPSVAAAAAGLPVALMNWIIPVEGRPAGLAVSVASVGVFVAIYASIGARRGDLPELRRNKAAEAVT
ncbi:MAG: lipopolysaccharide biosynthesis protein [Solirubrobacteraceae bacterium]|nr:lipopolysaccharide biosynthesis protein [Solirubrobacteraceae bacterium]